ncbi:MAG: nitrate- and nitrite sensing domain-containing protein [Burkholderiales bacterium]
MADYAWIGLLVLAALALALIYAANRTSRGHCFSLRLSGIRVNRLVKQLLLDLQQHRGMASAYLGGDKSFAARLEQKRGAIERDLAALDEQRGLGLMTLPRLEGIRKDWQALRKDIAGLTMEASFLRHCELIRAVLYLMGDVAERSQIAGTCAADAALVNALWSKLPAAAEGLGQARAMGASVAALGYCSSVARIKLRFLEERVGETMGWVGRDLARAGQFQAQVEPVSRAWEVSHQAVREFLALLDETLINAEQPTIDAEHYFGAATQTLDSVFRVFDQASDMLENAMAGMGAEHHAA